MKARILLDAYFTISPSKVAVITNAPTPLEIVWENRNPDPIWVTALKIASYVLLAPLALLALFAKCALYCKPLHTYAPRLTKEVPQPSSSKILSADKKPLTAPESDALCNFVKQGADVNHPEVQAAIAEIVKDKAKIASTLNQLQRVFRPSFPPSGAKEDYSNDSLLTAQQKTYLKNYLAIKTRLVDVFLPKNHIRRQHYVAKEKDFVCEIVCAGWLKLLNTVYFRRDNYMSGYTALKAYYQDVLDCYAVTFLAAGQNETQLPARARSEVSGLLIRMATTHWTDFYLTFAQEYACLGDRIAQFPKLVETLHIVTCICKFHEQMKGQSSVSVGDLRKLLDVAL
jgi:hypothetical protein